MVKGGLSICFLLCFVHLLVCLFSCRNDLHSLDESWSVPLAWKRGFCRVLQHIFWWDIMNYQCQRCPLKTRTQKRYLKHLEVYHQSEPNFVVECSQNGCPSTYTKISSLRKHINRKHIATIQEENSEVQRNIEDHFEEEPDIETSPSFLEKQVKTKPTLTP